MSGFTPALDAQQNPAAVAPDVLVQPLIPPPRPMDFGEPGMTRWPFANRTSAKSVANLRHGPLPQDVVFLKDTGSRIFAVRASGADHDSGAGFVYHAPPARALRSDFVIKSSGVERSSAQREPLSASGDRFHSYVGADRSAWRTGLPVYAGFRERFADSVVVEHTLSALTHRYHVILPKGADVAKLRIDFGYSGMIPRPDGSFVIVDGEERVANPAPRAYQLAGSTRIPVDVRWLTAPYDQMPEVPSAGFAFRLVDATRDLHLELEIARWSHAGGDIASSSPVLSTGGATAVDQAGNVYVAGRSRITEGAHPSGMSDLVVQKFDRGGKLLYTTMIGGDSEDGKRIALAARDDGSVYVAGSSWATNFPVTRGAPCKDQCAGIFVAKLDAHGALVDSAIFPFFGNVFALAVDRNGMAYVGGSGRNDVLHKVATSHGFTTDDRSGNWVAKVDSSKLGSDAIVYASWLNWLGSPIAIAFDGDGNLIFGGGTSYRDEFVKTLPAPGARTALGGSDGYVAKIDPTKRGPESLVGATLVGALRSDPGVDEFGEWVDALAVDVAGNIYAAGGTASPGFPTTANAVATQLAGDRDAFLVSFDPSLTAVRWSTLLGGSGYDGIQALAVDSDQNVYVAGATGSAAFPVVAAVSREHTIETGVSNNVVGHVFAAKLSSNGSRLVWSTLLGGGGHHEQGGANFLAIDGAGNATVGGEMTFGARSPEWSSDGNAQWSQSFIAVERCRECPPGPSIDRARKMWLKDRLAIDGNHFATGVTAIVNGVPATSVVLLSSRELRVEYTPTKDDRIEVTIVNGDGQSATASVGRKTRTTNFSNWIALGRERLPLILGAVGGVVALVVVVVLIRRRVRRPKRRPISSGRVPPRR